MASIHGNSNIINIALRPNLTGKFSRKRPAIKFTLSHKPALVFELTAFPIDCFVGICKAGLLIKPCCFSLHLIDFSNTTKGNVFLNGA